MGIRIPSFFGYFNSQRAFLASQMAPEHFLLALPDAMFALGMGTEFYIVDPLPSPAASPDLFEELFTPLR